VLKEDWKHSRKSVSILPDHILRVLSRQENTYPSQLARRDPKAKVAETKVRMRKKETTSSVERRTTRGQKPQRTILALGLLVLTIKGTPRDSALREHVVVRGGLKSAE
jgi:hypothetical protein